MRRTDRTIDTSPTAVRSTQLSGALFDDVLSPLAEARRRAGAEPYFPTWRDGDGAPAASYFVRSGVSALPVAEFDYPGGGTGEGLIDALAAHWTSEGETGLAAMAARLKEIVDALREEAVHDDGTVDIFCYTLF